MSASRWTIAPLLLFLLSSATSSPVSISTSAPPLLSQISPPRPTILPSLPSPSSSVPPPLFPPLTGIHAELTENVRCPLMMSPSTLVVRYGDPATANCSALKKGFQHLGWEVSLGATQAIDESYLVWSVDRMTEWSITPMCYALSDQGNQCVIKLPVTVFKPPDNVSISVVNHTGPMLDGSQYTLQCAVHDVAPVKNLTVTFYRGQTTLDQIQPNNAKPKPVTETFTVNITPSKDDDGAEYWCEATLDLGPAGPRHPLVMRSQKLTATVLFGPQVVCPTKLQVREGESLGCEVTGNPEPSVTWFKDGHVFAPPQHSSRKHAGYYTVSAKGLREKNFTVEVEILPGSGTTNTCNRLFLLAILIIQIFFWL